MWIALRLVNILSTISNSRLTNERVSQARRHRLSSAPSETQRRVPVVENACTVHPWCHHSNYVLVLFRCSSKSRTCLMHARTVTALIDKRLLLIACRYARETVAQISCLESSVPKS
ncbi:hypothetical protein EVAR_101083_1 [Eumeta japonica]|uniref:Uncharacterized protein n=1 Tax=Eumeta variegata TaxID=151549 RepID=A0A4C2ACV7_EUMVA|nr:hypothetical protein EVAR_101083_1 [Eumeta japonica]